MIDRFPIQSLSSSCSGGSSRDLPATRRSDAKEMIVLIDPEPGLIGAFRNGAPFDLKDLGREAVLTIKRSAVQAARASLGREPDMHQL